MGLDMYLYAKRPDGTPDIHRSDEEIEALPEEVKRYRPFNEPRPRPGEYYHIEGLWQVAYWRKANAIHRWFVENAQGGEDECLPHLVTRSQLQELRDLAQAVLDDHAKAAELLPTQSGFFFGPTQYGEWYIDDLKETVRQIDVALADERLVELDFVYCSSW